MCMTLSQKSPDETFCFQERLVFFKQQLCDNVCAVDMHAVHAGDLHKQKAEYILAEYPCCKLQLLD